MRLLLSVVAMLLCVSCRSPQTETQVVRDGSSMERAIILRAENQAIGMNAEREWIQKNLPGARYPDPYKNEDGDELVYFAHRTMTSAKRIYSVYTLQLPDGRIRDVYFDMSEYFGKFKKEANQQPEPTRMDDCPAN